MGRLLKSTRQAGFTLIELVTVIVIVGIIAVIGSRFIVNTSDAYNSVQNRTRLTNTGRQALARMARELRGALPYSVIRLHSGGNECIKFMPVYGGGRYTHPVVPHKSVADIAVDFYQIDTGRAVYLALAALGVNELTLGGESSLVALSNNMAAPAQGAGVLTFAAPHQWLRNSVNRRFYLLGEPRAFCVIDGELRYFTHVGVGQKAIPPSGVSTLVARHVAPKGKAFTVSLDTVSNRSLVTINLRFFQANTSVVLTQKVALRNVP